MAKAFDRVAADVFRFLIDEFGMRVERSVKTDYGYDLLYVNDRCGVHIVYEFAEAYVFLSIHRLNGGKFVADR